MDLFLRPRTRERFLSVYIKKKFTHNSWYCAGCLYSRSTVLNSSNVDPAQGLWYFTLCWTLAAGSCSESCDKASTCVWAETLLPNSHQPASSCSSRVCMCLSVENQSTESGSRSDLFFSCDSYIFVISSIISRDQPMSRKHFLGWKLVFIQPLEEAEWHFLIDRGMVLQWYHLLVKDCKSVIFCGRALPSDPFHFYSLLWNIQAFSTK